MSLFKAGYNSPEKYKDRFLSQGLCAMKKLLVWGAVGLLTTALLDPPLYSILDQPIPWLRDMLVAADVTG